MGEFVLYIYMMHGAALVHNKLGRQVKCNLFSYIFVYALIAVICNIVYIWVNLCCIHDTINI